MPNSLAISAPPGQSYILVTGSGFWKPEDLERHFRDLDRNLRAMRTREGVARVLVDLSKAKVQIAETAATMKCWTGRIYREEDQVAVLCAAHLLAMQVKHQAQIGHLRTFVDKAEAVDWLISEAATPQRARTA